MPSDQFKPSEERQKDLKAALDFVTKLKDGERVGWLDFERALGFRMDSRGKDLVRLAAKRLRRPYVTLPGLGIEMSSPENGVDIVDKKTRAFVQALDIAKTTTAQVAGRHLSEMTEENKKRLLHHQAVFGALTLSQSLSAKKLPA